MLEIAGLHVHYGLSHVLQGVALGGRAGEVVGLFGRNGVGKTTMLKAVAGWIPASAGTIRLDGQDLAGRSPDAICRLGVGFVPEDRRIFPGLTVEENLKLGFLQCPRRPRRESRRKLQEAYERFPRLAERRRQAATTLSGGEQQMLAIARVLVGAPRLLLVDEPTEGLAPLIVDEIFATIARLREEGLLVLLVEQNVVRALEVATRFYAVERGRIVGEGDPSRSGDRERLMRALAV
jgi:branched-chain amino acid transport system ATP-binding protein